MKNTQSQALASSSNPVDEAHAVLTDAYGQPYSISNGLVSARKSKPFIPPLEWIDWAIPAVSLGFAFAGGEFLPTTMRCLFGAIALAYLAAIASGQRR